MARKRIDTEAKLVDYLKRRLGAPQLRVEITDDQFLDCIYKAIENFAYYAYDGTQEATLLVEFEKDADGNFVYDYQLPYRTQAVTGLKASSTYSTFINIPAGYTLAMNPITLNLQDNISNIDIQSMTQRMAKMSTLRSIFDVEPNWDFNTHNSKLTFFEKPVSSVMLLELALDYEPEEVDGIYDNFLVKQLAEGYAWVQWATITGKYEGSALINGASIAYSDFQSKGEAMIESTKEEIMNLMEPLGVSVG